MAVTSRVCEREKQGTREGFFASRCLSTCLRPGVSPFERLQQWHTFRTHVWRTFLESVVAVTLHPPARDGVLVSRPGSSVWQGTRAFNRLVTAAAAEAPVTERPHCQPCPTAFSVSAVTAAPGCLRFLRRAATVLHADWPSAVEVGLE